MLAVFTGMRPGEMLALRWADLIIDDPRPVARVRRSLSKDDGGRLVVKSTKTEKGRAIALLPQVVEALQTHRKRQAEQRPRYSGLWRDEDLVFPSRTGGPVSWNNLVRRNLKPLMRAAGCLKSLAPTISVTPSHPHARTGREPQGCSGGTGPFKHNPHHGHLLARLTQHPNRSLRPTRQKVRSALKRHLSPYCGQIAVKRQSGPGKSIYFKSKTPRFAGLSGALGRTRTCDLLIRSHSPSRTRADKEGQGETQQRFYQVLAILEGHGGTGRDTRLRSDCGQSVGALNSPLGS